MVFRFAGVLGLFACCVGHLAYAVEPNVAARAYVPGQVLVKFKSQARTTGKARVRTDAGARVTARFARFDIEQWTLPAGQDVDAAVARLRASGLVEYAEPNYRRYARAQSTTYTDQLALQVINLSAARDYYNANVTTPSTAVIAVIDDAIDYTNAALSPFIRINTIESAGIPGRDDDQNGYVDDVRGWDFIDGDADPGVTNALCDSDDDGLPDFNHGTLVAGTIGAMANNFIDNGVNWPLRILPLRIGCNYSVAEEIQAMDYAIAAGANIINASYGGPQFSMAERDAAMRLAGLDILLVAAAGNYDVNNDLIPDYPSSLDLANVIAVAASDEADRLTDWTHFGQTSVDLGAPGRSLVTLSGSSPGSLASVSGTSFSAPLVAGTAALLFSAKGGASASDMKGAILASVDPLLDTRARLVTDGRLNVDAALRQVRMAPQPVTVIRAIAIDDATGNHNGLLDSNETVTLNVTLENVWSAATGVTAALQSLDVNAPINLQTSGAVTVGDIGAGGTAIAAFTVSADTLSGHDRLPFAMDIVAGGVTYRRYFEIEVGTLVPDTPLTGVIQATGNHQDEFHYLHVQVPPGRGGLRFELTSEDRELHLLVRYGAPPQFEYQDDFYADFAAVAFGAVSPATFVSAKPALRQTIDVTSPSDGTWYAVVLVPPLAASDEALFQNVPYTLRVSYINNSSGGCALTSGEAPVDPFLWLLAAAAALHLWWRQQTRSRDNTTRIA